MILLPYIHSEDAKINQLALQEVQRLIDQNDRQEMKDYFKMCQNFF